LQYPGLLTGLSVLGSITTLGLLVGDDVDGLIHNFLIQPSPIFEQILQLSLQQYSSFVHMLFPHLAGTGDLTGGVIGLTTGGSTHPYLLHATPGLVQIPQLSLQHTSPSLHIFLPHFTPLGTGARTGGRAIGVGGTTRRGLFVGLVVGVSTHAS
jgi:hypothetical protein